MDDLMSSLGKLKDDISESNSNSLELEWESLEAIKQAEKLVEVMGKPNYVNSRGGGSVQWFDIEEPMAFSHIKVEDTRPYSLLIGRNNYSSFTIILRLSKNKIRGKFPQDLVTYNHNQGKLTCYAETWGEAVIIATAVHMNDMKMIDSIGEMWVTWRDIENPTPFVDFLLNNYDNEEDTEEEDYSIISTEEESDDEKSPEKKIIKTVDKNKETEKIDEESLKIGLLKRKITPETEKIRKSSEKKKKSTPVAKTPTKGEAGGEEKRKKEILIKSKKSIKSPIGKPVICLSNGAHQNKIIRACSPPKSPIQTIIGSNPTTKSRGDYGSRNSGNLPPNLVAVLGKRNK
jgi:hypothetical protein